MSLGLLVGRFGTFVKETRVSVVEDDKPEAPYPDELNHLREAVGHHLIPLMLLARSDGDFAPREQDVIVAYCVTLARRQGLEVSGSDALVLNDYIAGYRPTLMQLDPALARLARGSHEEVAELVAAARAVVEADGVTRPEEATFLCQLGEDLGNMSSAP